MNGRIQIVDLARGLAIVLMVAFHFCWDLAHFGLADFDFYRDPFWLNARSLIVSLFLLLVGISLVLAHGDGIRWPAFGRRLLQIGAGAALVTLATAFSNPDRLIVFGILHFIAVASLLALPFLFRPTLALAVGIGVLLLDRFWSHPFFDQPWIHWIGLMTHKPATDDYVPVIPWLGVVLVGIGIGHWLRSPAADPLRRLYTGAGPARLLAAAGRHGLVIYLLHQPLLYGGLALLVGLFRSA